MVSSRLKSRRNQEKGSKVSRVLIAVLSTIGIIDTGSITFNRWGLIGSISCPGGFSGCDKVLNSEWGTIYENANINIPLSFLGLISYFIILSMAILPLILSSSLNKSNLIRSTWWGLFITSCSMTIFSLFLIGVMVYKIKAFCFFCILSGLISILILVLSIIGGSWDNPEQLLFQGTLLSLAILLSSFIWSSNIDSNIEPNLSISNHSSQGTPPPVSTISNPSKVKFAKYLTSQNIIMYSAYWCPHCHDQKELFGQQASKELRIIECAKEGKNSQSKLCDKKGIESYPSWEINGSISPGVRSLEELAKISNYMLPIN